MNPHHENEPTILSVLAAVRSTTGTFAIEAIHFREINDFVRAPVENDPEHEPAEPFASS
jgi:hypothetical protein